MKRHTSDNLKAAVILFGVILSVKMIEAIPWWSFVIPVVALGMLVGIKDRPVSCFPVGFLTGFIIWTGGNLYYHLTFDGLLVSRLGTGPGLIILLASGLIGGLLTGLSLYTGKLMMTNKKEMLSL